MNHQHDQDRAHAHDAPQQQQDDADHEPTRRTKSSQLAAPANPVASGLVQRKARDANGVADDADHAVAKASSSSGTSLPATIMRKFESSLGTDLSSVRVHTGSDSAAAAASVGAKAYTVGQDIHFAAGQYDPSSPGGQHLLAHEVAHTVQQRGGTPTRQNKLEVSTPFDAAEHEADRAADAMVMGRSAVVGSGHGIARQAATLSADDQARVAAAKEGFDLAVAGAVPMFVAIAGQQASIIQDMKEAALDKEPPPLALTLIATIAGAAIGAAAGPLGAAIASRVASVLTQKIAQDFAQKAVTAAVSKGGEAASGVAKDQISKVNPQAPTLEAYLNMLKQTFFALAGRNGTDFLAQMRAGWQSAKNDPAAAEEVQKQAEAARDGLQAGLDQLTFSSETQNAAFGGLCSILSHSNAGGILKLELMVANKGNLGPGFFESAVIGGITDKLAGIMTGRPLSSFRKMPIQINAYYFTERPKTGDQGDSDSPQIHQFTVNVSEAGQAMAAQTAEPWLLARGGGDANAGAKSLYTALLGVPVPLPGP